MQRGIYPIPIRFPARLAGRAIGIKQTYFKYQLFGSINLFRTISA